MTQQLICFWSGMNSEEQFHAFTFSPARALARRYPQVPSSYGMLNLGFYNSFREFVGFCFPSLSISENKQNGMGATSNSRLTKVANDPIALWVWIYLRYSAIEILIDFSRSSLITLPAAAFCYTSVTKSFGGKCIKIPRKSKSSVLSSFGVCAIHLCQQTLTSCNYLSVRSYLTWPLLCRMFTTNLQQSKLFPKAKASAQLTIQRRISGSLISDLDVSCSRCQGLGVSSSAWFGDKTSSSSEIWGCIYVLRCTVLHSDQTAKLYYVVWE